MKKHVSLLLVLSVGFLGILTHDAFSAESTQYLDPDIEQRIENQHSRIEDGIRSGKLTRDEARLLKNNLHHIQDEAMRLQADGKLSRREKDRLTEMLNQNGQMIQDKKQNAITDVAPGRPASGDPEIKDRIADQQRKINRGIQSGKLTLQESKVLNDNLNHIREEETRWGADGTFDQWEKGQLVRMLDRNADMIQDKQDNPIVAYGLDRELEDRQNSIPERIAIQHTKINRGIRNGTLTQGEATLLTENLDYIAGEERRLRRGGLSDREQERLHALLDQNRHMIQDKKSNPIRQMRHAEQGRQVNLNDLVGMRARDLDSTMNSRGFRNKGGYQQGHSSFTTWWNAPAEQCVSVETKEGRVHKVESIFEGNCK